MMLLTTHITPLPPPQESSRLKWDEVSPVDKLLLTPRQIKEKYLKRWGVTGGCLLPPLCAAACCCVLLLPAVVHCCCCCLWQWMLLFVAVIVNVVLLLLCVGVSDA
jgi:hypothetical protein